MRRAFKTLASWAAAAFWWIFGHLYGESIFQWIRPMIPAWIADPSLDRIAQMALVYVPPAVLLALGGWFLWANHKRQPNAEAATSRDVWLSNALWRVAIDRWARPDLEGEPTSNERRAQLERAHVRLRQAARESAIPVWHVDPKSGLYKSTPTSFWARTDLDMQTVIGRAPQDLKYTSRVGRPILVDEPKFMTSRKAVEGWLARER